MITFGLAEGETKKQFHFLVPSLPTSRLLLLTSAKFGYSGKALLIWLTETVKAADCILRQLY